MVAARLVLAHLCVVEVEGAYLSYHECLDVAHVATAGNGVGLLRNVQLCALVVELLHEDKEILLEVAQLLLYACEGNLAVTLGHAQPAATFAPIEQRYLQPQLHILVVVQAVIGRLNVAVYSAESHLRRQVNLS